MNTLELIQTLKQGQRAVAVGWDIEVTNESGDIIVTRSDARSSIGKPLTMTNMILNQVTWDLIRENITVQTAIDHVANGKPVTVVYADGEDFVAETYDSLNGIVSFYELRNGQWFEGAFGITDFKKQ